MINFEDAFILALYFGGMLSIVLWAYYSQNQEENEDISLNIPLPLSPIIYQSNNELEESKEESKEDIDEYHLEQGTEQGTEQETDNKEPEEMMIETNVNNNSSVINRKEISELESHPDVISIQEEDTKKNQ